MKYIIESLILPKVVMPRYSTLNGALLLGPPGVGKSYAISAVRYLCRDLCQVSFPLLAPNDLSQICVHDLKITDILTDQNPVKYLIHLL